MASNYTTNYQLNQWEGTDKVLRTEFNADNSKIDAALKANADAIAAEAAAREALAGTVSGKADQSDVDALADKTDLHLILAATHDGSSEVHMSVPLTGINWTAWKRVHILFDLKGTGYDGFDICLNMANAYTIQENAGGRIYLVVTPLYGNVPTFNGLSPHINNIRITLGLTWDELSTLDIYRASSGVTLSAGSKVTFWGEK